MDRKSFYQVEKFDGYYRIGSAVDGMTLEDMFKPGFAAVVIAPDWH